MDTIKTGTLIRELRKEHQMTQKDLADQLHITDRAVSKWERGLCAPDIATLEPLAAILQVTVTELIAGERMPEKEHIMEIEANVQNTIDYSEQELTQKTRQTRTRTLLIAACLTLVAIGIVLALCWWKGLFHIIERSESPDDSTMLTIYDCDMEIQRFADRPAITIRSSRQETSTVIYENATFVGVWWAPDSSKYVLAMEDADGPRLVLNWMEHHVTSNLNAYLSMGVELSELAQNDLTYQKGDAYPDIHYEFLQWGNDSASMLIYYAFEDTADDLHERYFWYNCETGEVNGILELASQTPQ